MASLAGRRDRVVQSVTAQPGGAVHPEGELGGVLRVPGNRGQGPGVPGPARVRHRVEHDRSQRPAILSIGAFFVLGIVLSFVDERRGKDAARIPVCGVSALLCDRLVPADAARPRPSEGPPCLSKNAHGGSLLELTLRSDPVVRNHCTVGSPRPPHHLSPGHGAAEPVDEEIIVFRERTHAVDVVRVDAVRECGDDHERGDRRLRRLPCHSGRGGFARLRETTPRDPSTPSFAPGAAACASSPARCRSAVRGPCVVPHAAERHPEIMKMDVPRLLELLPYLEAAA